ncbi:unnamed protein product (macronuclear) [Paramecium tetraurelia]|uniref:Uncharacterized protein n=1 Tax=Paramecium tetraurelia TaxID=5888 RepID=A0C8J5_PARTE|nr:uncharacterized protein GSPATT00036246001 [Paramecium tetraurelia]CAK67112.1 unnamed protein product [Paramecium tetraurelia]|eukprot:XP_001434509.1 hypothetical protein (macronuclear) [Paramecium tetraurelia strain d4-2]
MPRNKKKCGRPSKSENSEEIEYQDEGYIATNQFALELLQLITEMANYKLLTITGPAPGKKDEEKKKYKKKCLKSRKEIEKEQKWLRSKLNIKEDQVFFLRNQDDNPRKYRLVDGKLVECGGESSNNIFQFQNENYEVNDFMRNILRVCNELNTENQKFIKQLVMIFFRSNKSINEFQEQFFLSFNSQSEQEYKELRQWDELFEISFDEKLSLMQSEIDQFKEKYSLNLNLEQSQLKVEQKRMDVLKNQQLNLEVFKSIEGPNRPLKLFTRRIHSLFYKHFDVEE